LEICEQRDVKGMYRQAREGLIKNFTGVNDPYEPPLSPEIVIDAVNQTPEENAERILAYLVARGFVMPVEEQTNGAEAETVEVNLNCQMPIMRGVERVVAHSIQTKL